MDEPPLPEVRASDADRERVAERLRRAAGDGQLTVDELDERLEAAYGSRTRRELVALTADLQPETAAAGAAPVQYAGAQGETGVTVRPGPGGSRWLVAIMGGCDRKGRWRLAERATSLNLMGGSDLDLTEVELAADTVELTVISIMGGADIRVPEGINVEVSEFAFMGGNTVQAGASGHIPGAPTVRLRLHSIMGGADVKRGPKLSRAERRALKRERRQKHLGH